jgi:hypothetical protein
MPRCGTRSHPPAWADGKGFLLLVTLLVHPENVRGDSVRVPQVSCRATKTSWVDAKDLTTQTAVDTTEYEISGQDLFILPSDRARYRYNSIQTVNGEMQRFQSGHFTLLFSQDHRRLLLVRTNEQDVKVTTARCTSASGRVR